MVEALESRSLLSGLSLNGFPVAGFRPGRLAGDAPWDVAVIVDNQPARALAYAEPNDAIGAVSHASLIVGSPNWIAGIIGDIVHGGSSTATNDVDFYQFELPGDDHYAVRLDVIAERFGSLLNAAVTVFDGKGGLIATNDDALQAGSLSDASLTVGLDSGKFYVAVTASGNVPGALRGFDPFVAGSGKSGGGTAGQYLLQVSAEVDNVRPEVLGSSVQRGDVLQQPPSIITVQFSERMNLAGLQTGATLKNAAGGTLALVPVNYDPIAHSVSYLILERPVAGDYEFALHAVQVTDLAANPLNGGGLGGDFHVEFHVESSGLVTVDAEANEVAESAQVLGPLFEKELTKGVRIDGVVMAAEHGATVGDRDFYRFEVLRSGLFAFRLKPGAAIAGGTQFSMYDASGNLIVQRRSFLGLETTFFRFLRPGEYTIQFAALNPAATGSYELTIQAAMSPVSPLVDHGTDLAIKVLLETHDGEFQPVAKPSSASPSLVLATDRMAASVSSLLGVESEPVGRPQEKVAEATELAWVDTSPDKVGLPPGFTLGNEPVNPVKCLSVVSVSGSFLDPLPDATPYGTQPLNLSTALVRELAQLVRGDMGGNPARAEPAATGTTGPSLSDFFDDSNSQSDAGETAQVALSPARLSLGVMATVGFASSLTVPNRRRNGNWLQRAFQLLGVN